MSVVRVLFLGTPEFAVPSLQSLLKDEHFEVTAVVTQPDRPAGRKRQLQASPVKKYALEKGLRVLTPEKIRKPEALEELAKFEADAAVVVAYGQILPQEFLNMFSYGAVNIHSSLLPRWRGAAPMQRALMAGDKTSGVSLQKIVLELDAGDVLGHRSVELPSTMDAVELHDILKELACELLEIEFMDYVRGNLAGETQDASLVTHAPKIRKEESKIDWSLTAEEIHNQVRGLAMGPQAWSEIGQRKIKILKTCVLGTGGGHCGSAEGEVVEVGSDALVVACGQGRLEVLEVQPESKSRMKTEAFLRGYPISKGDRFGESPSP